jgi:hypothetical protein
VCDEWAEDIGEVEEEEEQDEDDEEEEDDENGASDGGIIITGVVLEGSPSITTVSSLVFMTFLSTLSSSST